MRHLLRAFRHYNFRLFFSGQIVSVIGTWVHTVAMSWLVYRLSGSALLLGLTGFATMFPILLFAPLGGVLADRVDRRKLLIVTQALAAIHALTMAGLAWAELLSAWHVIALATMIGVIQATETPLRQSFLPVLVPAREDLPSAVAFGAFMQQAGRLIGPTIAGLLLTTWSEAVCFLVNGLSKIGVIVAVLVMVLEKRARPASRRRAASAVAEALRYSWNNIPVRILLPTLAAVSFLVAPYQALMPIFAAEIYQGGADTMGYLMGAAGLGGGISVLVLAARKDVHDLERIILGAAIMAGVAVTAFSQCRWYWPALLLMAFTGAGMLTVVTGVSTILQTIVDDEKRGRVMSFYTMSFLGTVPVGSLAAGAAADVIGATLTLALSGSLCIAAGLALWTQLPLLRTHVRAHYARLGIIEKTP